MSPYCQLKKKTNYEINVCFEKKGCYITLLRFCLNEYWSFVYIIHIYSCIPLTICKNYKCIKTMVAYAVTYGTKVIIM